MRPRRGPFRRRRPSSRSRRQVLHIAPEGLGGRQARNLRAGNRAKGSAGSGCTETSHCLPQNPQPALDAAIFRMTPTARRRSRAHPAHTPSQSASQTHLAPPPPRRVSGRRLQVPEGPSRISPRVFYTRQWVEAPREPAPAPPARSSQLEGVVCVRGQVGRGTRLRTRRPC
ncbi:hypothetical protein HPG69_007177 [Diceros bicornis minor]|uniref:Uncharacterized protein n=1 Tax=Diceros bicornis minor TaxID=77932 RepID=A0A7J7EYC5_DICBM|nr:hypothetical protein HPG69_007177 [Diceros bicornis minor]